ncbi:hypothetical protein E2C01_004658 [Portunus trituberculatus]|uniref:Uncharacterized protein n=1 Tax=Portunus trituberculatus TaxID=210409 RepID=A0A5B7CSW8_PORTR|nr:hypothetical protein [Portunus trituberculatus]
MYSLTRTEIEMASAIFPFFSSHSLLVSKLRDLNDLNQTDIDYFENFERHGRLGTGARARQRAMI